MNMKILTLTLAPMGTKCYIAANGNDALIIDPASSADMILSAAQSHNLTVGKILLTHGHFDHIGALDELVRLTGADAYVHELDAPLLTNGYLNASRIFLGYDVTQTSKVKTIRDGDKIRAGQLEITVMHTPGHTAGSVCCFCENAVFTGDTLFHDGYGRTDLPTGDGAALERSLSALREKIGANKIYPGH